MQVIKYAFQQHGDDRGMLVALEEYKDIPFSVLFDELCDETFVFVEKAYDCGLIEQLLHEFN